MTDQRLRLVRQCLRIGAVQFGRFEVRGQPGAFAPLSINLRLLPSYADLLRDLAAEIAPLTSIAGLTHLLTMPATTPLGVLTCALSAHTLVYPLDGQIEGAYDFSVPTLLLTDVLTDGMAERALIKQAQRDGLDIEAILAVVDFGRQIEGLPTQRKAWIGIEALLDACQQAGRLTTGMRAAVDAWLAAER